MGEEIRTIELFNTPVESALRSLLIINEMKTLSLDQIILYDYLCLNSGDFNGPPSIHAPIPNRNVQILIRRQIIKEGLKVLISKELISVKPLKTGMFYTCNKLTQPFISAMVSNYKIKLSERVTWAAVQFKGWPESKLRKYLDINIENWKDEITTEKLK